MYKFISCIIVFAIFAATTAQATLLKTTDPSAVCNDGRQAAFMVSKSESRNWFIYFEGGGAATTPDAYKKRQSRWKKPITDGNYGLHYPIVKDFKKKGFNVVGIPYCTSIYIKAHTRI